VSKKRDRGKGEMNEYFRYENKKTLESLSLMIDKFILGDSPIPSYVGFSRKNVNKKSLKRILGDLSRRDFTGEEIVAIESVIVMNDTSILEAKVLGQMGVEDTSNPSNVIKYAEFLLEAEEGVVDIKKSIFYNLSCCNEKKDRESVKKLLKIINGPEPIESCEYINLYVVNGFDGEKLGGKIIAYLTSKIKDRKDITKKEYDHLWKQIFFQGDRDRNKYNRKERIISKEDCVKISMLLNDKKEIIIKEPE
jgi:hypothetical protein